ncbi:uncharacterized protein LOC116429733 [Nomia melanderi]|uniref:uncharacterized protein LOC116429733 n=1 Tax=Nomia melanderi TaxID=2448451 RepID=UPI0013045731|nr:uncharacterized protein LOC116429733 [Nomia melanderi]
MSERKVDTEIVRKEYTNDVSLIDEVEIIDVSVSDFNDTDTWLYIPLQYQSEASVQNLYTWLKNESELILPGNRRFIDTRTFTRPKKRTSRNNFESILENLSPPVSSVWKTTYSNFSHIGEDLSKHLTKPAANKEETVHPMLKMAPNTNISFLSDEASITSGQESMEIFLNMSHSKGIDSFINLVEPGLSDPIMNVSQPSIFYSSITSLPRDDSLHNADCDKEDEPANLTHSLNQQAIIHKDIKNPHVNETFSMVDGIDNEPDNNKTHCLTQANRTFTNKSDNIELNETYDAEPASSTVILTRTDKDRQSTINLSSTFVNKDDGNIKLLQLEDDKKKESSALNSTYSTTEVKDVITNVNLSTKNDAQDEKVQACDPHKNTSTIILENVVEPISPVANSTFSLVQNNALDSTFKLSILPGYQSTPKNPLNSTFQTNSKHSEKSSIYNAAVSSNFKASTSLRKELLAEIHRNTDHKLDGTYNCVANELHTRKTEKRSFDEIPNQNTRNNISIENKYSTYKKDQTVNKIKVETEIVNDAEACVQNLQDKKYYTFTKKSNIHVGKTDMENAEPLGNVDATFVKPLPKLQKRQQHIPRMLSKLPQFLQKSNPNLVSNSLKTVNMAGCTNASTIGYMKGSQLNIVRDVEKGVTNKLYSLGKMKSGSEQRLLELNTGVGELQMMGAGGSTESIESTQSAHSAPDLDDRLSTCSDSSHNSYTVQPMNIEQLHQIVRMQEESLKQDAAPVLNKHVMESTWTDMKKNLPSPILKNGTDGCESDSSSLTSMDFNVKTSSPLISPTRSSQSVNTDDHSTERKLKQENETDIVKKAEAFSKPTMKFENKTRLRQPTNWNTGNRTSNMLSAIPRPPSRIPGPRTIRPTIKNTQGDVKRGYM